MPYCPPILTLSLSAAPSAANFHGSIRRGMSSLAFLTPSPSATRLLPPAWVSQRAREITSTRGCIFTSRTFQFPCEESTWLHAQPENISLGVISFPAVCLARPSRLFSMLRGKSDEVKYVFIRITFLWGYIFAFCSFAHFAERQRGSVPR